MYEQEKTPVKDPRPVSTGPADSPEDAAARAAWLNEHIDTRGVPNPPRRTFPGLVKVQITNAHGTFTTDALALDLMIMTRLPASRNDLCAQLAGTAGRAFSSYDDISTVTEFLIMMADADYPWKGTS